MNLKFKNIPLLLSTERSPPQTIHHDFSSPLEKFSLLLYRSHVFKQTVQAPFLPISQERWKILPLIKCSFTFFLASEAVQKMRAQRNTLSHPSDPLVVSLWSFFTELLSSYFVSLGTGCIVARFTSPLPCHTPLFTCCFRLQKGFVCFSLFFP